MEIRYKGLQYDLPAPVTERAEKKLLALKKYLGKEDGATDVYVELGKETDAHQTGRIWVARINFSHNGTLYRSEAIEETIENAIDHATDEIAKELRRSKKKNESLLRKGGLLFKSLTQRSV